MLDIFVNLELAFSVRLRAQIGRNSIGHLFQPLSLSKYTSMGEELIEWPKYVPLCHDRWQYVPIQPVSIDLSPADLLHHR